ncbi:hypothetical protein ACGFI9_36880 [Micromonospora sp. NPDC048930]|uniref:hypothetical protein n=1 Tax=Micromonospora sp. NPDC048930 TaxID=3364261 RepID=UPI00371195CD
MTPFEELIATLEEAGLWSDIAEDHKLALLQALFSDEDVMWTAGGAWRADGEDLAEGEVEAWVASAGVVYDLPVMGVLRR